jgi:hypothetical protein
MKPILPLITAIGLLLASSDRVSANGREVQREVLARIVSVNSQAGTFVVEPEFRGTAGRVTLRLAPGSPIFSCSGITGAVAQLRPGDRVSVYYEVMGREGLVNLVVIEPRP